MALAVTRGLSKALSLANQGQFILAQGSGATNWLSVLRESQDVAHATHPTTQRLRSCRWKRHFGQASKPSCNVLEVKR